MVQYLHIIYEHSSYGLYLDIPRKPHVAQIEYFKGIQIRVYGLGLRMLHPECGQWCPKGEQPGKDNRGRKKAGQLLLLL